MRYPRLDEIPATREVVEVFRGYNHNLRPDEGEFLHVERIPFIKATEMVLNNQIFDAKTQIAVLKASALLQSGRI